MNEHPGGVFIIIMSSSSLHDEEAPSGAKRQKLCAEPGTVAWHRTVPSSDRTRAKETVCGVVGGAVVNVTAARGAIMEDALRETFRIENDDIGFWNNKYAPFHVAELNATRVFRHENFHNRGMLPDDILPACHVAIQWHGTYAVDIRVTPPDDAVLRFAADHTPDAISGVSTTNYNREVSTVLHLATPCRTEAAWRRHVLPYAAEICGIVFRRVILKRRLGRIFYPSVISSSNARNEMQLQSPVANNNAERHITLVFRGGVGGNANFVCIAPSTLCAASAIADGEEYVRDMLSVLARHYGEANEGILFWSNGDPLRGRWQMNVRFERESDIPPLLEALRVIARPMLWLP